MARPFVFGVDLDGVVADYTAGFRRVVAADRGVDPDSLPEDRSWDFHEWGLSIDEFNRLHRLAVAELRMLATLPVVDGAADALWRLSDAGVWIRIVTHRLYVNWGHAAAIADTVTWLDEQRIPYRDICFLGAKPEVEADCYVDDAPHNVEELRAEGNDVIVFDQPYNRGFDGLRAKNWAEVEAIVVELAAAKAGALEVQLPGFEAGADRLSRRLGGG
jgi:5'-nucleotidase